MKQNLFKSIITFGLFAMPFLSFGQTITLGNASKFVLLTTTGAVTNSGTNYLTHLTGKVGSNSGSSTGFGNVDGGMHDGDVVSNAASSDLLIAYSQLNLATPTSSHSSALGSGETLLPGVFNIATAATLNSDLILDGNGDASSVFIFKINGALSAASGAKVKLINGALACNVYWKTEGLVSIGSNSTMRGNIVAHNAAIAFGTGDSLEGRALAINGAITMNSLTAYTPIGCGSPVLTGPVAPTLGAVGTFAIFSSIGPVSNGGAISYVTGDIGTNLGLTTNYDPLYVNGTIHPIPDGATALAATALSVAYGQLNALPNDINLLYPAIFGHNLVLTPHTYLLNAATSLTDTLILNAQGNANAVFVLKVNGALNTITGAVVKLVNGAKSKNVYWKVEGAVSLANNTTFHGTVVANNGAIDITSGAKFFGRALTTNGAITTNGDTINALVAPSPSTISGDSTVCVGSSIPLMASDTGGVWSATNPRATVSSTGMVTGVTAGIDTILYTVTNSFGTAVSSKVITVRPNPNAGTINGPSSVCIGSSITLTDTTSSGVWSASNTNSSVLGGVVSGISAGLDTIRYTVTNSCGSSVATKIITIQPTPTVNTTANQVVCNGAITAPVTFGGAVAGTTYTWTNNNPTIGLPASGTGNIAAFTANNITSDSVIATITVTPSANGCTGLAKSYTYTVRPTPTVNTVTNQVVCNGALTSPVTFSGAVSGTSYSWTNDNSTIGLPTSGTGNIPVFTATNTTGSTTVANITIMPSASSCLGSTKSFSFTVHPTPTVSTVANQVVCNGILTAPVMFSGAVSGTTYTWVNDNTSVGLPANGTGNISAFTASNITSATTVANVTVTPSANGCFGSTRNFSYTIHPTPTVNTVANQVVCNGALTAPVTFSGTVSSTAYTWTNDNTTIGLPASGTGNIPVFTATNTTGSTTVANIIITPSANTCSGNTRSFSYTVHPTPTVNPIANQVLCNGALTTPINFAGAVSGTLYSWTNDNTSIGLASNGTGNISSFTASNTSGTTSVAKITIMPSANGCMGSTKDFLITVHPTPTVSTVANQVVCNGALTAPVNFIGAVSGTTYSWTNDNTTIGLTANGTGNIPVFVATNGTSTSTVGNIVITPSSNGCNGNTGSFSYTVHPTPTVNSIANQVVCNGALIAAINFSGAVSGSTYNWTNSNSAVGLANFGTGNIASFIAMNTTNVPIMTTIVVSPTANACGGASKSFTITVNPTPVVAAIANQVVCNGLPTTMTNFNSSVSGTTYSWTNNNNSIGLGLLGTGNIPSFFARNNTDAAVVATITVTPSANGCQGANGTFTYTVNPTPNAPRIALTTPPSVCHMTYFRNFGAATLPPAGTQYSWSAVNAQISDTGSTQQYSLVNFKTVGLATVILTATVNGTGCKNQDNFTVAVTGNMADVPAEVVYFNKSFVVLQNNEEAYSWGYDNAKTLAPTYLPTEMNQDYVNANPQFDSNNYWVMVTHDNCIQKTYYNKPSGALMKIAKTEVSIFPNPAGQQIKVGVTTTVAGSIQMEIYSMMGQKMYVTNDVVSNSIVDLSLFPSGIYVVVCYRNNEKISTSRFMKN